MALPDPGAEEVILQEVGQVIRGQFGSGSPSQLIPVEGKPITYTPGPLHGQSIWPAVWDWITGQSGITSDVAQNVATALSPEHILSGLSHAVTALSGFINLSIDYTATVAGQLGQIDGMIFGTLGNFVGTLEQQIINLEHVTAGLLHVLQTQLADDVAMLEQRIANTGLFAIRAVQLWAIDNIFTPLEEQLGALDGKLTHLIDAKSALTLGAAEAFTLGHIAPILSEVTRLQTQVAALQKESEECTQPMCESVGPKTDWGKWLKRFGPLALWAMLAAVAAEDPHAMETLAQDLGRALGPTLDSWVSGALIGGGGFPSQPASVGGAIGRNPLGLG